jgi:hypothetical protein
MDLQLKQRIVNGEILDPDQIPGEDIDLARGLLAFGSKARRSETFLNGKSEMDREYEKSAFTRLGSAREDSVVGSKGSKLDTAKSWSLRFERADIAALYI